MGNLVVSVALKAHPPTPLIKTYIACQSAEVAQCYDQNLPKTTTSAITTAVPPNLYRCDPPSPRLMAQNDDGNNYHKNLSARAINPFINFFNDGDAALSSWDINQRLKADIEWNLRDTAYDYKPNIKFITQKGPPPVRTLKITDHYFEDPPGITGLDKKHELYWPVSRFTIIAHIISAQSRATGAIKDMNGEFDKQKQVNLFDGLYNFGAGDYSHSAQFLSDFPTRRTFYFQLMTSFKLSPDPRSD